jgi:hypothetical protein
MPAEVGGGSARVDDGLLARGHRQLVPERDRTSAAKQRHSLHTGPTHQTPACCLPLQKLLTGAPTVVALMTWPQVSVAMLLGQTAGVVAMVVVVGGPAVVRLDVSDQVKQQGVS